MTTACGLGAITTQAKIFYVDGGNALTLMLARFVVSTLVFGLFLLAGHPWLYLLLWVLPYACVYQVLNRLRAIAEHGGLTRSPDRLVEMVFAAFPELEAKVTVRTQ